VHTPIKQKRQYSRVHREDKKVQPLVAQGWRKNKIRFPNLTKSAKIYQLHVSLEESNPLIWRRFLIPGNYTLADLHDVLQRVMGWQESHLHEFIISKRRYGDTYLNEEGFGPRVEDQSKISLNDAFPSKGKSFRYIYDFGDDWIHKIKVEDVLSAEPKGRYPVCLDGEYACPPEDSGGIFGLYENLRIMNDPSDPEYEDIRD